MSGRIPDAFSRAKREDRAALITYLCAGDPDLDSTPRLIVAMAKAGADIIEVGVPFSDPTADGRTIQHASERALRAGTTVTGVLAAVARARAETDAAILLFGYYNPIFSYGEERLCADAARAGADGLLVVDLPSDEAAVLRGPALAHGLDYVPLLAPTSTSDRVDLAGRIATSFVYYVSMTGVTGAVAADLSAAGRRAHELSVQLEVPVAVGFGIANPAQVRLVAAYADAVVVGSAIVRAIEAAGNALQAVEAVTEMVGELRAATVREGN